MSALPPVHFRLEYPYTRTTGPIIGAFLTALRDGKLRPLVLRHIEELVVIGTPAMKARGRKLIGLLDPHTVAAKTRRKPLRAAHNTSHKPSVSQ